MPIAADTYVLGINFRPLAGGEIGHHPSAALLKNGLPAAMCQEERFVRIKEAPGLFPLHAIQFCLATAGIGIHDLAAVGWNWDPVRSTGRRLEQRGALVSTVARAFQTALRTPALALVRPALSDGMLPDRQVRKLHRELLYWFDVQDSLPVFYFDHHLAHAASAYYPSGFDNATVVTWDGWGDHLSGLVARGERGQLVVVEEMRADRMSLGLLNDFVYAFIRTSEKGNLMGLAPYGKPSRLLDQLADEATLRMRTDLLAEHSPFPESFVRVAGRPRRPGEPLEQRHKDLAADLQRKIEAFGMKIAADAVRSTGHRNLCLAGGCALNATLNGKIGRSGLVDKLFVQPDAGDGGGALGAAYLAHLKLGQPMPQQALTHAYWGPSFSNDAIAQALAITKTPYEEIPDEQIPDCVSRLLTDQKIVGWFQLGSEWGPRALGARSILADPRTPALRDRINEAVKYRDWWRPFAPSILAEAAEGYLEDSFFTPFMTSTFQVRASRASEMAGVTHVDGTTRPQMVVRDINPRYFDVIQSFGTSTGIPMVLNTSFNLKGEPIVNTPRDALRTFFGSGLDVLIMNNVVVRKGPR